MQSGSPDALLRRGPLRTVRATRRGTRLKQATGAISGVQRCWFLPSVGSSVEAGGVNESGLVRQAVPVDDDDLPGYRLAGGAVPLFPLAWALWLAVGVQEQFSADRAGSVLPAEQVQGSAVEQRFALAAPFGPVAGLGGVVRRRVPADQPVPDDFRPGELGEIGAAVAVAEHPTVLPVRVV